MEVEERCKLEAIVAGRVSFAPCCELSSLVAAEGTPVFVVIFIVVVVVVVVVVSVGVFAVVAFASAGFEGNSGGPPFLLLP